MLDLRRRITMLMVAAMLVACDEPSRRPISECEESVELAGCELDVEGSIDPALVVDADAISCAGVEPVSGQDVCRGATPVFRVEYGGGEPLVVRVEYLSGHPGGRVVELEAVEDASGITAARVCSIPVSDQPGDAQPRTCALAGSLVLSRSLRSAAGGSIAGRAEVELPDGGSISIAFAARDVPSTL